MKRLRLFLLILCLTISACSAAPPVTPTITVKSTPTQGFPPTLTRLPASIPNPTETPSIPSSSAPTRDELEHALASRVHGESSALCEWEVAGQTPEEIYVWAYCQSAVNDSAVSAPAVIHIGSDGQVQRVDMPRDGTYYGPDVRALFPPDMQRRIFAGDFDVKGMAAHLAARRARVLSQTITPTSLTTLSSLTISSNLNLGKLAYIRDGDIWVKSLPNGQPQRLTTDGHSHEPRWSSSGQWLAFRLGDSQVWVMRADGSANHPVNEGKPVKDFTWAPNIDRLAYIADDGVLSAVSADGSDRQAFIMPDSRQPITGVESLTWSPDGQWLAFVRFEILKQGTPPGYDSVWRVRADGSEAIELFNAGRPSDREFILAGWSSDSNTILLWINPGFSGSILADGVPFHALPVNGGAPIQFAAELDTGSGPRADTVLYHSDFIALAHADFDAAQIALTAGGYRGTWTNKRVGIVDVRTGNIRLLTSKDQAAFSPDWSPDGTHLVYVAMPDKGDLVGGEDARLGMMNRRIYIVNTQGDPQAKQLTNDPAYRDERPLWSADGSSILLARMNRENRASLWLVSTNGGELQQVVDELTPAPEWFGYYGYIDWSDLFDWWSGSP